MHQDADFVPPLYNMWMACATLEETSTATRTVAVQVEEFAKMETLPNSQKVTALSDFGSVSRFRQSSISADAPAHAWIALFQDLEALPNFEKVTVLHQ